MQLAALAERYFPDDPNTSLIKTRQFGEALAQQIAASTGVYASDREGQIDLLHRLRSNGILPPRAADLFHSIRRAGNEATHNHTGTHADALQQLKLARELAVWFHRSFGGARQFKAGPFVPPQPPERADDKLKEELGRLRDELSASRTETERAQAEAETEARARLSAEEQVQQAQEERALWESLAEETEARFAAQAAALQRTQAESEQQPREAIQLRIDEAARVDTEIDPDEATTRLLIDEQLRLRGWEADTQRLTYAAGTRPHKSRNIAISEWPTASGPVDYALFCGLTCVGVVEAKRFKRDVPGHLLQTKRYSRDFTAHEPVEMPQGGPWGEYRVPFVYATNGRPFLQQLKTKSGIWFWDARHPSQPSRPLPDWYTPKGLLGLLQQDLDAAEAQLETEPFDYLGLRDYQQQAIVEVEKAIESGQRECLLSMATGTGKTRTAIGLVYRMVKSGRFRRVLFLVDRSALGDQAAGAFKNVKLEQLKSFAEIYDMKELDDTAPDDDTRLHIATIQGTMRRLFFPRDDTVMPTVDQYDCIVVDEAHRGYTLDKEMTEGELLYRSDADYISKYRRVIDYFDAIKVGLTATPALHTTEIFGDPVYTYSYRDAVIDGWLIDHEPPYRIKTKLGEDGIEFEQGEEVQTYDPQTGQIDLIHMPDTVDFEIESFNRDVITENFTQTVCRELARHIDPTLRGKTLIFCLNREHGDQVVTALKSALVEQYGEVDDDAVARITGEIDRPGEMIRRYKNERLPNIAVTVDLLTTGIDVPEIVNLVFLRRVRSRILYEQMLGRATRLCPEIGKEYFRVFDCVDLYDQLATVTNMKPVVQSPHISFEQLVERAARETDDEEFRAQVLDQTDRQDAGQDQKRSKASTSTTSSSWPMPSRSRSSPPCAKATQETPSDWLQRARRPSSPFSMRPSCGRPPVLVHLGARRRDPSRSERGFGFGQRSPPTTSKRSIATWPSIKNEIPALIVVTQRPRDLTRADLREIKRQTR